jgi:hypothetical protein
LPTLSEASWAALKLTRPPGMLLEPVTPSWAFNGVRENLRSSIMTGSRVEREAYSVTLPRPSATFVPNSRSNAWLAPSPSAVSPNCTDVSKPSTSSRRMKFTAPAIASDP